MSKKNQRWISLSLLTTVAASLALIGVLLAPNADAALPGPAFTGCFVDAVKHVEAGCCQEPDVRRYEVWLCDATASGNLFWRFEGYRCVENLECR